MDAAPPPPRWPYLAAAPCVGAAVALVVYRFAVLGLGWRSPASFLFPALTAALLFGVAAWLRAQPTPRRVPPLHLLGALGVAALGATLGLAYLVAPPLGASRLAARELPGFSVDLPSGTAKSEVSEYDFGVLQVSEAGGYDAAVSVQWGVGAVSVEDLELAGRALATAFDAGGSSTRVAVPGPDGSPAETVVIAAEKGPLFLSMLPCGERRIILGTVGSVGGVEALHRRIVASFRCTPVAAREHRRLGEVPVVLELPGFFAAERLPGQLTLSDGSALLILSALPQAKTDDLEKLLPAIFETMGARVELGRRSGARRDLVATIEGERAEGWFAPLACEGRAVVMLGLAPERASADDLARRTEGARCLRPGEAPQVWPDPPPP